jgi:2-dehydro-3-deoxyphosphogalactonate aldolase
MKLADIETFVVGNPPPHFGGRYFVFVKLTTACGISGIGEAYCVPFSPHLVAKMIEDVFARYAAGRDPHDIENLWRRVYSSGFTQHSDLSLMGVLSALEMACWDIVGKAAGQPVYKLLGGQVHERLRAYTYIYPRPGDQTDVYHDPDLAAERSAEYLAMGFTALKFDPAGPYSAFDGRQLSLEALDLSERFANTLREAVGSRADLLFGTHGQMTAAGAIRLAKRLEAADPLWLEEPVPPDAPEEMAKVARATSIPIATGERLSTKYDFARLMEAGGAVTQAVGGSNSAVAAAQTKIENNEQIKDPQIQVNVGAIDTPGMDGHQVLPFARFQQEARVHEASALHQPGVGIDQILELFQHCLLPCAGLLSCACRLCGAKGMRRVTAADERRPLQMRRRCISAACRRLGRARVGLIVPLGGSDGFFHFVFVFSNNILNRASTDTILCC